MSDVLFDTPGPRARARNRVVGAITVVVLLAAVGYVIWRFLATGQFDGSKWTWLQYKQIQLQLLEMLWSTLRAFLLGALLALVVGTVLALARRSDHRWLRLPAFSIVEFFRAIPLVILIFFLYYAAPKLGATFGQYWSVVLGLTIYNGSVLAEVLRAGIAALPAGQSEAAYAVGMRKSQVMAHVVFPQAFRAMLPAIISQLVVLLKDTALGFLITYQELLYYARYLGGIAVFDRPIIPVSMVVAALYISMCLLLTGLARFIDQRNRRGKKTSLIMSASRTGLALDAGD